MKTRIIPLLTVAAATCSAFASFADLEQRDSAQFTYKYEMLKLPTAENLDGSSANDFSGAGSWCSLGTGSSTGTVVMAISGSQNFISGNASGTAGDVWQNLAVTAQSGYTIETRLKVAECTGTAGTLLLNASYGVVNHNSWLQFYKDRITWGSNVLTNMDTSVWHTYRLVGTNNDYQVYVDGVLVNRDSLGNGFGYSSALNRLLFGGGGGTYAGKAQVAFLRFTKGAYAPPTPNAKSHRKASTDFPVQYEMSSNDDRISTTGNTADWTKGGSGATLEKSGGQLSVTMNSKVQAYWQTTDKVWKSVVTPQTPFTVEFRVKINNALVNDRAIILMTGTSGPVGSLYVGAHSASWQVDGSMGNNIVLDTSDNTDDFHVFRIAYDGATRHGFTVWRDGIKIGEYLVDCTNYYNFNGNALGIVRFGVASSGNNATHGGSFDIDYIRWDTTGAYDWKNPPKGLKITVR